MSGYCQIGPIIPDAIGLQSTRSSMKTKALDAIGPTSPMLSGRLLLQQIAHQQLHGRPTPSGRTARSSVNNDLRQGVNARSGPQERLHVSLGRPIGSDLASFSRFLAPSTKSSALLLLKGPGKCPRDLGT